MQKPAGKVPFGERRMSYGSSQTDKLFTSQRAMTGLGIIMIRVSIPQNKIHEAKP